MAARRSDPTASVETIRREAEARLRELAPALEEAEKLRDVLAVIDGAAVGSAEASGKDALSGPAASGTNKRRILDEIAAHPGITPREIALRTGIKRTVVASTVNRLKRRGEVRDRSAPGRRGGVAIPAARRAKPPAL